jgi:hypothetical protein
LLSNVIMVQLKVFLQEIVSLYFSNLPHTFTQRGQLRFWYIILQCDELMTLEAIFEFDENTMTDVY